ncbi:MAG TPA: hypothetical protein VGC95_05415 [Chitinophagaceae bacterium]|jgi:hypothetical protein
MTLEELYNILESKVYYEKESMRKFSFTDNSIHIDRKALIPFFIYKEEGNFFLAPDTPIAAEKDLRIEINSMAADHLHLYGKESGNELLKLEA